MEVKGLLIFLSIISAILAFPLEEKELASDAKSSPEYVFVKSSGSKAKPIARKDKTTDKARPFETSHKLPPSLLFALNEEEEVATKPVEAKPIKGANKKVNKRAASPADLPAPAPPGAIKLNVAQLLEKYKQEIKTSTTEKPSSTTTARPKASRRKAGNKRTKKQIKAEDIGATSPSPVLTTSKIEPKSIDTDVVGAASDKQRSRIQIKKGPNGQEYEYEYVYYYYDDDEDSKVTNSHDGPARNSISRSDKNREKPKPETNEVVPSRGKSRSRQLGEEDAVQEEKLPANTSRHLNTTPIPEEETKSTGSKSRGRGRPTTTEGSTSATEEDNVSDETKGSRGRTRANVRRPSLELVDSETFNTHSAASPAPAASAAAAAPSFPAQLPAGPEEPAHKDESPRKPAPVSENHEETSKPAQETAESTTVVAGMEKVALDLYAISQGTQKLFGEEGVELSTEEENADVTTLEPSTEETDTTTSTTTTTTTTTTTPAPTTTKTTTTTTTTEAPTKASRFGGRRTPLSSGRKATTTTTEAAVTESKPKKFGRPSFGGRSRTKPTQAPSVEEEVHKEESKPVSQAKPTRSRFGASRTRTRTTAASEENKEESSTAASSTTHHKPALPRARPSFNSLRSRGRSTTAASPTAEGNSDSSSESSSSEAPSSTTTARSRRIAGASNIKPLRPGPRINNLAGRRTAQTTTTTTEAAHPEEDHVTGDEETHVEAASEKEEAPAPAPVDNNPLGRLRNKNRINIQPKAKSASAASASAPVQVRRVNPLLNRRRLGQTTEAPSSEAPASSEATEAAEEEPAAETEASSSSSTTTEEPKGLSKLLAGRRRLSARTPGTINHKTS